jgi:hypothetical protein
VSSATYLCGIWCMSDCAHGEPCTMRDGHEGREHLAYDSSNARHEWVGWKGKGRCRVSEPVDES